MKPSLIFCKQFIEKHGGDKKDLKEEVTEKKDPIKKRRGRKPGKKEEPANTFKIENREIVIDFL
jgi:hypothetical protein